MHHNGEISIHVSGTGQYAYLEIPGRGCRQLESMGIAESETSWRRVLANLIDLGALFTRIDWAFDDLGNILDFDQMLLLAHACGVTGGFHQVKIEDDLKLRTGESVGRGLRFGSRKSQAFIRMYWKIDRDRTKTPYLRTELEFKDRLADASMLAFLRSGGAAIRADLAARICFRVPNPKDSNRSRWPVAPFWNEFLSRTAAVRIHVEPDQVTPARIAAAIERQYGPYLRLLMKSPMFGQQWLDGVLERSQLRCRPKHYQVFGLGD